MGCEVYLLLNLCLFMVTLCSAGCTLENYLDESKFFKQLHKLRLWWVNCTVIFQGMLFSNCVFGGLTSNHGIF